MESKKRRCSDIDRYRRLRELRQWRDRVLSDTNPGRQRRRIANRPEVMSWCWDASWTTYVTIVLDDGYEISLSSSRFGGLKWNPGYEVSACLALYRVLAERLRTLRQ